MSDVLFGGEKSGTPIETRGATGNAAYGINQYLQGGGGPMANLQSQSLMSLLGFDPGTIGFEGAATSALRDPTDVTAGLFRSLEPFEKRFTERSTQTQLGQFGGMGGRFSRNASDADTMMRGELGNQFATVRETALLEANNQRNQVLAALLGAVNQAGQVGNQQMGNYLQFLSPGSPNWQQGILGDLLGAAGNVAGAYAGGGV